MKVPRHVVILSFSLLHNLDNLAMGMDAPVAASRFLRLLGQSKLLPPKQVSGIVKQLGLGNRMSEADIAQQLVEAGVLTRYQADRLLAGRSRGFFYGPYKILDAVGMGGMSRIFLAEESGTGERVALKTLSAAREHSNDLITRLKLEARVGEMLQHSHLLQGRQLEEAGGSYYLVMEYVRGIELYELIQAGGPVEVGQACDIVRQAAMGLHFAHQAGIVHRDVKTHNLLIDQAGHVKVLDFGLAHLGADAFDDEFSLSMIYGHNCLGTVFYISPEQSLDSDKVDARSDVYSLGCTLFHTLTGEYPFEADGSNESEVMSKILSQVRRGECRRIREIGPGLPAEVAAIVERMMAVEPADRYQSAAEAAKALAPLAKRKAIDADIEAIIAKRADRARNVLLDSEAGSRLRGGDSSKSWRTSSKSNMKRN